MALTISVQLLFLHVMESRICSPDIYFYDCRLFCQYSNEPNCGQMDEKRVAFLSLFVNLGLLFAFKYFNFAAQSAQILIDRLNVFYSIPQLDILLPVGILFYTFQTLSYTVDVYKREIEPEKHLGIFALYVSFWPQLVASPIERASKLLPQFYLEHKFEYERVKSCLVRIGSRGLIPFNVFIHCSG